MALGGRARSKTGSRLGGTRADGIIQNWLGNRNSIELLGIWEQMNDPSFKPLEFEGFRKQAGLNSVVLTPKGWTESTAEQVIAGPLARAA